MLEHESEDIEKYWLETGTAKFWFSELILKLFGGFDRRGLNFYELKSGKLLENHAVATWNLGTNSAFA